MGEALRSDRHSDLMVEAMEISAFLSDFIDKFHHQKEERFLFPFASARVPALGGTVAELVSDHTKARELLDAMNGTVGEAARWAEFSASASSLIAHMTQHINREELSVFGMIEEALSPAEDREIRQAMTDFANAFRPNYYRTAEEFSKCIQDRILGPDYFSQGKKAPQE